MECETRCWRCCIKADFDTPDGWLIFLNRQLAGPRFTRIFPDLVMCNMLTANSDLQTTCLIYEERPKWCRESLCLKEKQNAHAARKFGSCLRQVLDAIATAISSALTAAACTTAT